MASGYFADRLPHARVFLKTAQFCVEQGDLKEAAFLLHQSIEQAYSALLLVLTNYSPASHNLRFLRSLAEEQHRDLVDVWPRSQQRHASWFNVLNEAYVKAQYTPHFEISKEAWIGCPIETEYSCRRLRKFVAIISIGLAPSRPDGCCGAVDEQTALLTIVGG